MIKNFHETLLVGKQSSEPSILENNLRLLQVVSMSVSIFVNLSSSCQIQSLLS